jgi:hypothetical protein
MAKLYRDALTKLDYEDSDRRYQAGSDGTEETKHQVHGPVKDNVNPSEYGIGHGQPDPMRHLDDNSQPDPLRHAKK